MADSTVASPFDLKDNAQLYSVLGVERTATEGEIRRAFKKLAVLYHPDKNPDGAEKFKEVNFAHTILTDAEQRRMYDCKTLRTHLDGQAKAYDPSMDPNVELTTEQLKDFVERLHREQQDADSKREIFERKRAEEMKRREEFDARNPHLSAYNGEGLNVGKSYIEVEYRQQQATTAELMDRLANLIPPQRTGGAASSVSDDTAADPLDGLRGTGHMSSYKAQMLNNFRSSRRNQGKTTVEDTMPEPHTMVDTTSSKYQFVAQNPAPNYAATTRRNVEKSRNFNYEAFVVSDLVDGGVVKDAILADALGDYDPTN